MKNCISEDGTVDRLAFCLSGLKIISLFKYLPCLRENVGVILEERRLFKGM